MQMECDVIRDLLPLYIDNACSEASRRLVETHLVSCENCRKLYEEMRLDTRKDFSLAARETDLKARKQLQGITKNITGVVLSLTVMVLCFAANTGGAWMGDPAHPWQFLVTLLYVVFWGIFSYLSRKHHFLCGIAFVISLLSAISSVNSLIRILLGWGDFTSAFLSVFASVPFYGLRLFLSWRGVYLVGSILSVGWLLYTSRNWRRMKRLMGKK